MNKGKIGILEQVREKIEQNGTISNNYIDNRGCMCAVGYVMSECGVDMDIFEDDNLNTKIVPEIFPIPAISEPLEDFGFNAEELEALQEVNDIYNEGYDRAVEVVGHISKMIRDLKRN